MPTPFPLQVIFATGAGERDARGGVSGRKVLREEGGGSAGEGGRNGVTTGRTHARRGGEGEEDDDRTEEDDDGDRAQERGQDQVSSNGDWGELRERDVQEESDDASEGWSGGSAEDSAGSETK